MLTKPLEIPSYESVRARVSETLSLFASILTSIGVWLTYDKIIKHLNYIFSQNTYAKHFQFIANLS